MIFEGGEIGGVIVVPVLVLKLELREEAIGFVLCLGGGNAGLEAANDGKRVAPGAPEVHDDGNKQVDLLAGSKDSAEVKAGGKHTHDGDRAVDGGRTGVDRRWSCR